MTNLETAPTEQVCADTLDPDAPALELLTAREVPLGGIRAMTVRRTIPQRRRSFIGAWCFLDHYGPDDVAVTGGMRVPPHPHTGLQTVSWLFSGEVEHRDSLGTHAFVRPGELNLMTAGRGISHSEDSTDRTTTLHGVQMWVVLPEAHRDTAPAFTHHVAQVTEVPGGQVSVFLGSLVGVTSPVATFSPLLGAEVRLRAGTTLTVDVDTTFEHGILVDDGAVTVGVLARDIEEDVTRADLLYAAPGVRQLTLTAHQDTLLLLIGGRPLGEQVVMWWNFIGRDHGEIETARREWQAEIGADDATVARAGDTTAGATETADLAGDEGVPPVPVHDPDGRRYGHVDGHPDAPLPAPPLPNHRLKPRS
ncbi:pirin family protein [Cellulomonas bogoriensis]|uniref:Pirin n=1 Tax=Cellulomonas bogoriensis 69B4 = DSM 16987 TaxID=1386082 RepID=A0A0A0BYV2_9CELL|nr:pirin family protein [Cellulomonas bogoriensis]KGM12324.1 pirin [Cellulomonas bogoriensis 69B4 = DSM 16987]